MSENLKDILSNLNPDIDQETLLLYLQGKLTPEKQHELEMQMMDNEFMADALEGLDNFKDKQKIALLVDTLNADLRKKAKSKKSRKKRPIQFDGWILITAIIMLLLIILSYFIIHQLINN